MANPISESRPRPREFWPISDGADLAPDGLPTDPVCHGWKQRDWEEG